MVLCNIGIPEFKIANLFIDIEILKKVQELAEEIINKDTMLENTENKLLKLAVYSKFNSKIEL